MKSITKYHDKTFKELSQNIVEKSIQHLQGFLSEETKKEIRLAYKADPDTWWSLSHFGWGMFIRNSLRDNVCLDDKLPSQNWDDYYVRLVEIACGLKEGK